MCKWCENIGKEAQSHDKKKRRQKETHEDVYNANKEKSIKPYEKECCKHMKGRNGKKLAHIACTSNEENRSKLDRSWREGNDLSKTEKGLKNLQTR